MTLTVAEIERWDAGDVREVFHAASDRAQAARDAANGIATLPALATWGGVAAAAAEAAIGQTRRDLDAHRREALVVANAARCAAEEIERIKSELATLRGDAAALGLAIDAVSGRVVAGPGFKGTAAELVEKQQQLQPRVGALVVQANLVDLSLANAIRMADGTTPIPISPTPPLPGEAPTLSAGGDPRYTRSPLSAPIVGADPSAVEQQLARVDTARANLDAAQSRLNAGAAEGYTSGAGGGPGRDGTHALSQSVFDARRELTQQTAILSDLNQARSEVGGRPVGIPALPENTGVQSFPPPPSAFAEGSRALSEGSFGLIPDVAKDIDVFSNWGKHSGADQAGAVIDVASSAPIPGAKFLGPAAHGMGELVGVADNLPTSAVDDLVGGGGHSHAPGDHTPPVAGDHSVTHAGADAGHVAHYGVEDAAALLTGSEANGGHLIREHVGRSTEDLAERLVRYPRFDEVSTFRSLDEAATAVSEALQHNQQMVDNWIAGGAIRRLELDAPFNGGAVLHRGAADTVSGTSVRLVLKGNGTGGWYVLTGFINP